MSLYDRQKWEQKYLHVADARLAAPLPSLRWLPRASSGAIAIDVACGRGRHSGLLRELGYRVVCVDIAHLALGALRIEHRDHHSGIWAVQADLDDWPFASDAFDLVVQTDFLDRRLLAALQSSTKTSGLVLIDTFRRTAVGAVAHGPSCRDFLLETGEIERHFDSWEILRLEHDDEPVPRVALLARKPAR